MVQGVVRVVEAKGASITKTTKQATALSLCLSKCSRFSMQGSEQAILMSYSYRRLLVHG